MSETLDASASITDCPAVFCGLSFLAWPAAASSRLGLVTGSLRNAVIIRSASSGDDTWRNASLPLSCDVRSDSVLCKNKLSRMHRQREKLLKFYRWNRSSPRQKRCCIALPPTGAGRAGCPAGASAAAGAAETRARAGDLTPARSSFFPGNYVQTIRIDSS